MMEDSLHEAKYLYTTVGRSSYVFWLTRVAQSELLLIFLQTNYDCVTGLLHVILGVPMDSKGLFSKVSNKHEKFQGILRLIFASTKLLHRGSKMRVSHAFVLSRSCFDLISAHIGLLQRCEIGQHVS